MGVKARLTKIGTQQETGIFLEVEISEPDSETWTGEVVGPAGLYETWEPGPVVVTLFFGEHPRKAEADLDFQGGKLILRGKSAFGAF